MTQKPHPKSFAALLVLLAALVVVLAPTGSSLAAKKLYHAADTDASAGVAITIYNDYASATIGSADIKPLSPPSGFAITGAVYNGGPALPVCSTAASPSASCYDGGRVVLRSIAVPAATATTSGQKTVTISVTAPSCYAGTLTWSVLAKQANNFQGTGNDFVYNAAYPAATSQLGGGCKLVFSTQPGDSGLYPSSKVPGPPTVRLVSNSCDDSNPPAFVGDCTALTSLDGTLVTVSLVPSGNLDPGSTTTAHLTAGEASFSDLRVTASGSYQLRAATSSPSLAVTSVSFAARSDLCTVTNTCSFTQSIVGNTKATTNVNVFTGDEQDVIALDPLAPGSMNLPGCNGSKTFTHDGYGVDAVTSDTSLPDLTVATVTYSKEQRQLSTDNGIGNYDVCFEGMNADAPGTSFRVQTRFDPNADGWSTPNTSDPNKQQGVLLACSDALVHATGWVNDGTADALKRNLIYPCEASSVSINGGGARLIWYVPAPWDWRGGGG